MRRALLLAPIVVLTASFPAVAGTLAGDPPAVAPSLVARAAAGEATLDCIVVMRPPSGRVTVLDAGPAWISRTADALAATWEPLGARVVRRFSQLPLARVEIPAGLLSVLAADPLVAGIAPNRVAHAFRKEGKALMRVGDVQARGWTGRGVGIAILDTGVDYSHKELSPGGTSSGAKTVLLFDAIDNDTDPRDENGHGTSVAGIAAGSNGGVAPQATVVAVRVLDKDGEGSSEQILAGVDAVLASVHAGNPHNIRVANLSLGGYDDGDWPPNDGACDTESPDFAAAFGALRQAGVVVAVAAGNGGCSRGVAWPACLSDAMAVGAVYDDEICQIPAPWPIDCLSTSVSFGAGQCMRDGCSDETKADRITCYSDSGSKLEVWAPSTCAKTTARGGGYEDCFGGTSAAAPYVAGVAALLTQALPDRGPTAVRTAIRDTGRARTDSRNDVTRRRVDALAALDYLTAVCRPPGPPQGLAVRPATTCPGMSLLLTWSPVSGASSYAVQVADGADFAGARETTTGYAALAVTAEAGGTLWLRVRAETPCGVASVWSAPLAVPVAPTCPRPPRAHLPREQ